MRLRLLQGDIADWAGDCVVNAANLQLEPSNLPNYWRHVGRSDVNTAIHQAAGPALAEECANLPKVPWEMKATDRVASAPGHEESMVRCPRGEARLTAGHQMKVQHIIHTVGPDYTSVRSMCGLSKVSAKVEAESLLKNCYTNVLALANQVGAKTIGMPAISCGVLGFGAHDSVDAAARVAIASALHYAGQLHDVDFILKDVVALDAFHAAAMTWCELVHSEWTPAFDHSDSLSKCSENTASTACASESESE